MDILAASISYFVYCAISRFCITGSVILNSSIGFLIAVASYGPSTVADELRGVRRSWGWANGLR
jgi:hypothetical protein